MTARTVSQAAVSLLLKNDQPGLARLSASVDRVIADAADPACPNCGERGMEDNGCHPDEFSFTLLCVACGQSHAPNV